MRTHAIVRAVALLAIGTLLGWAACAPLSMQAQEKTTADPHGWLGTETVKTRFGDFEFKNGYPTPKAAEALLDQHKFNRAVEVYLTQLPAVSMIESRRGAHNFGAKKSNQAIIW